MKTIKKALELNPGATPLIHSDRVASILTINLKKVTEDFCTKFEELTFS
ncbi:TPA: hypothetical protein U1086_002235 [Streptococcus suis]|nr:hypothetical protein [Streptococcus suis]